MQEILNSFNEDLSDIEKAFSALKCLTELRSINLPETIDDNRELEVKSAELHGLIEGGRNGIVKIPGIFVLYLGGRFEDYIQTIFEELAIQFANSYNDFESLPAKFKKSLISDTSKVISSPIKYGYPDSREINNFIKTLSKNVNEDEFSRINHQCLSKTEGNMRSKSLSDLFSKIAIKEIWKEIGMQSGIRTHFGIHDYGRAQNEAIKYLDDFMDLRNRIAHPNGGSMTWPSYENVVDYISYFKKLSKVIFEIGEMKIASISAENTRQN